MAINPIAMKREMAEAKAELLTRFREGEIDAQELISTLSANVDESISRLADEHLGAFKDKVAFIFTGANGRQEVCPHSDLDIFALVDDSLFDGKTIPEDQNEFAEAYGGFYYAMMDAGLSSDLVVLRTASHCVEDVVADQETWTQFIDRRKGWGSDTLFDRMNEGLASVDGEKRRDFIQAKFDEYDKRLAEGDKQDFSILEKGHTSKGRYAIVEPNVKNGYGGLRGYQTAHWVSTEQCGVDGCDLAGRGIIEEADEVNAKEAYDFLMTVRCHLHDIAGREDDFVHSHVQPVIAERMGYEDVTAFMKDYFSATREISHHARMICSDVAEQLGTKPPGAVTQEALKFKDGQINEPMQILQIFYNRAETGFALHHTAMQAIRKNTDLITDDFVEDPEANRIMLDILSHENAAEALMRMNRLGALTKFIPELEGIRELVQFDPYHAYTVDDHTIVAIGNITALANQEHADMSPVASRLAADLTQEDREILSVALLLHDVHKADQPEDMKVYNRDLVQRVGARLGLEGDALETASWLAENHLLMKHTARYQDIEDQDVIAEFASKIPDVKHLDLLRVMMMADTLALGPERLSHHAAYRADSVYEKARNQLTGLSSQYNRNSFQLPEDYEDGKPYVHMHQNKAIEAHVMTVITPDKPYLMENITAAIFALDCKVLNARVTTVANGQVRAANTFVIHNSVGEMLDEEFDQQKIRDLREAVLAAVQLDERMELVPVAADRNPAENPKNKVFEVVPGVEFSNALSDTTTMVQITARDRPHLLHALTSVFNDLDLDLEHANITTQGHRAVNVFRVHMREGGQISPAAQVAIRDAIMEEIGEEDSPEVA